MIRLAGCAAALAIATLITSGPVRASEHILGSQTEARCAPPEVVKTSYEEQVCYLGPSGYEACRWLPRTHTVEIPATCEVGGMTRHRRITK